MLKLFEFLAYLEPFTVDLDHVEVILNAHHVASELTHCLLLVVSNVILLQQFVLQVFEVEVDIEVLKKTAVANFFDVSIVDIQMMQPGLGLHDSHIGHHLYMSQHRCVKTFGLFLLLADEDVLIQKVFKRNSFFSFPPQQLFDEFVEFFVVDVFVNNITDLLLVHVFYFDFLSRKKP